jgi:hypothetical protein
MLFTQTAGALKGTVDQGNSEPVGRGFWERLIRGYMEIWGDYMNKVTTSKSCKPPHKLGEAGFTSA